MAHTTEPPADASAWGIQQVARYLDVSERHVLNLRRTDPTFPTPRMVGRRPRWSPSAVPTWVAGDDTSPAERTGRNRVR